MALDESEINWSRARTPTCWSRLVMVAERNEWRSKTERRSRMNSFWIWICVLKTKAVATATVTVFCLRVFMAYRICERMNGTSFFCSFVIVVACERQTEPPMSACIQPPATEWHNFGKNTNEFVHFNAWNNQQVRDFWEQQKRKIESLCYDFIVCILTNLWEWQSIRHNSLSAGHICEFFFCFYWWIRQTGIRCIAEKVQPNFIEYQSGSNAIARRKNGTKNAQCIINALFWNLQKHLSQTEMFSSFAWELRSSPAMASNSLIFEWRHLS